MNENIYTEMLEWFRFHCEKFRRLKGPYSALSHKHIGSISFIAPERYQTEGVSPIRKFEKALTSKDIEDHNDKSHSLNKDFIRGLCSLMKDYKICEGYGDVVPDIQAGIQGSKMVGLCFSLRNRFEHPHDFYYEEELKKKMLDHFGLKLEKGQECPLPVETVIKRIHDGCLQYIEAKLQVNFLEEGSIKKDFLIVGTANGTMGGNVNLPQWL